MSYDSQTEIANRHDFDKVFTNEYDNDQTAAIIITPTPGKRLKVVHVHCNVDGTSGAARFYFASDENGNENTVNKLFAAAYTAHDDHIVIRGARNEPLRLTTTFGAGVNYFVSVSYKEE